MNNESLELNEYRIHIFRLRDYFEAFFSSCYLGLRKPNIEIYKLALKITQREPAECVMIDDRGLNLETAKELGMHTIQFKNVSQMRSRSGPVEYRRRLTRPRAREKLISLCSKIESWRPPMKLNTRVSPDIDSLSRAALEQVLSDMQQAVKLRGRFAIALSGGHTPRKNVCALGHRTKNTAPKLPGTASPCSGATNVCRPRRSPQQLPHDSRNAASPTFPFPPANVHPAPTNLPTPQAAAAAYDADLHKFLPARLPAFDVTLLGVGPEGHTASLFPGSPALEEKKKWVEAVTAKPRPPIA